MTAVGERAVSAPHPRRGRPAEPGAEVISALLALAGVRAGAVVLDLTPGSWFVRAASAAAGREGVVLSASPAALAEGLPAALRGAVISHAFATLPGSRLLTALRPVLRSGARVAVTAVDGDALREAVTVAAYDLLHVEEGVEGVVCAAVRPRPPS